jgi:hypothetical protein
MDAVDKDSWPNDPHGYIFLLRAFDQLGRFKFGPLWTAAESRCLVKPFPLGSWERGRKLLSQFDNECKARIADAAKLVRATKSSEHEIPGIKLLHQGQQIRISLVPTKADWQRAVALNQPEYEAELAVWNRRKAIQSEVVALCESGKLASVYRPYSGGHLTNIVDGWWRTEQTDSRFQFGLIYPDYPFKSVQGFTRAAWLFLNRSQLEEYISSIPDSPPAGTSDVVSRSHTGFPGAPTSRHLIEAEFARRIAIPNRALGTKKAEAESLCVWLAENYPPPHAVPAASGTIQNHIRNAYNEAKLKAQELT